MPGPADLAQQLADEQRAKERQYVLANTRARWGFVGIGVLLLASVRLAGLVPVSWVFIGAFTVAFAAINYGMSRMARERAFQAWFAYLNIAIGAAKIGRASCRERV